jgi:hypothetical protein
MEVVSLGWRTDLMMLRLQGSTITDQGTCLAVRTPSNPTYWWGNFILYAQPPAAGDPGRWLAHFAAEFPEAGHLAFGVDGTHGVTGAAEELIGLGLSLEVSTVLTARAVREPPRPNRDAEYRPLISDEDWAAAVAVEVANREDDGDERDVAAFEALRMQSRRRLADSGHGAWFGGFLDGRLVTSLGIFTDGSGIARFQSVNTLSSARGRGLAGTTVYHAARYGLTELGADTLVIVADQDAVAARVYRSVGFADSEAQVQFERGPLT